MDNLDLLMSGLPCNPEAEQSIIGSMLIDSEIIGDIVQEIRPEHFYVNVNRGVFEAIFDLFTHGDKVDIITVLEQCRIQNVFKSDADAKKYLVNISNSVPSTKTVKKYVDIVIEKYLLRSLISVSREIIDTASNGSESAESVIDLAEQKIFDIREGVENKTLVPLSKIAFEQLKVFCDLVEQSRANKGQPVIQGLMTGYKVLDKQIYGLNRSDLIILAARPGMGKTAFALNIAVNVSKKYRDKAVCIFSLEMSKEQLVSRMMSSEARVSSEIMRTGRVPSNSTEETDSVIKVAQGLESLDIYIDDTAGTNVPAIKAKLRRIKNLGLVIIDFLQLMNATGKYNDNRVSQISEISRSLKIMAKELNVPVIVLSQLSRSPEARNDKRPMLSDLRESGSIEQDADIVMFLYRNSYYEKDDPDKNSCECIVAKNRHGETGTVMLGWQGEYTLFTELKRVDNGGGQ